MTENIRKSTATATSLTNHKNVELIKTPDSSC